MSVLLTTVILAIALMTPNLAKESQNLSASLPIASVGGFAAPDALEAAKTAFLSLEDYARYAALEASIDPSQFQRLIACESRWKEDAAGDNGTSFGLLQFKRITFSHFLKKYPILDADMDDPRHQIDLAAAMIANGHLEHWKNCSRKIGWNNET